MTDGSAVGADTGVGTGGADPATYGGPNTTPNPNASHTPNPRAVARHTAPGGGGYRLVRVQPI